MNKLSEISTQIFKKHQEAMEALTVEQFSELVEQAVKSGDFMRHVESGVFGKQGMTYIPFREKEEARIEKIALKSLVRYMAGILIDGRELTSIEANYIAERMNDHNITMGK